VGYFRELLATNPEVSDSIREPLLAERIQPALPPSPAGSLPIGTNVIRPQSQSPPRV
jgi:hypothetical protein